MTTINDLSNEMLIEIFSYIQLQERQRLVTVCKRWDLIIESMWRTINKLIIKIKFDWSSHCEWEDGKWANIMCQTTVDAVKVLEKFNGTLTKLDLEYDIQAVFPPSRIKKKRFQLLKEIQKNEQLTSVRIDGTMRTQNLLLPFLEYLPTKNLHLSLYLGQNEDTEELIGAYESFMETASLKYLYLDTYWPWMHNMLHKMDTLESLHIDDLTSDDRNYPPLCLSQFPNLKELTIHRQQLTHNEFFHTLGTTPNSLHALDLSIPSHEMLSQDAFECIANLRNLSYLILWLEESLGFEILSVLPNLEELYIYFGYRIEWPAYDISRLKSLLVKMPQLKKCWFYNDEFHEALKSGNFLNKTELKEPEELTWTAWKRIFGFPQNHFKEKCCLYN